MPRPMPLSDPVTMATFESNCPIQLLSFPNSFHYKQYWCVVRGNQPSPRSLIEGAIMLCLRVIRQCLFPCKHDNPCPSVSPVGTNVSKEIIREDGQTTTIANEVIEVQENPHEEAKEACCVYRP